MTTDHTQPPCLDRRYYRESSPGVYELTEDGYYRIILRTKNLAELAEKQKDEDTLK